MKEVRFMMLAAMCMAMFSFTSCSDDDDFKPEDAVQAALTAKYPNATHIEWEKKKTYLVADCHVDGKDLDVWFTADAQWKMTETELLAADLPAAVTAALAAHATYGSWRVDDRDLLQYANGASEYVIEVEEHNKEVDLYFSADGELLDEVDVTTGDDTHWPE
ncbi:PepSY-like domain-containing protein [Bacteroides sp. 51]|uniref:PepSY-like domain-containing protein n=1 Tax=Bacteroides sp. 51 TaxID=2302938 RepID=UPI0013D5C6BF|nr:PepSY-like domain-containing protein [Bacteroides sp. 51]NDV83965.1 ribosome biogenesis protein [Bacteroides sp. 51]